MVNVLNQPLYLLYALLGVDRKYSEVKIYHPFCISNAPDKVLAAVGQDRADHRFQKLLTCLSHPPSYTCVRASTHLAPLEEIRQKLGEELKKVHIFIWMDCGSRPSSVPWLCCCPKQQMCNLLMEKKKEEEEEEEEGEEVVILTHPRIPDVLLLPVNGPRYVRNVWSVRRIYWTTFPLIALLIQLLAGCFQRLAQNILQHLTERSSNSSCAHKKRLMSYMAESFPALSNPNSSKIILRNRGSVLRSKHTQACVSWGKTDSSLLMSDVWRSSAQRLLSALSVAVLFWEALTSSPQGSSPAQSVGLPTSTSLQRMKTSLNFDWTQINSVLWSVCVGRHEGRGRGVGLLRHRGSVHTRRHQLPGEQSVCGKWRCADGPFQHLRHRRTPKVCTRSILIEIVTYEYDYDQMLMCVQQQAHKKQTDLYSVKP